MIARCKHWMPVNFNIEKVVCQFPLWKFEAQNSVKSGRPSMVTNTEIVDHIHDLYISERRIAKTLEISRKCTEFIIHKQLGIQKSGFQNVWILTRMMLSKHLEAKTFQHSSDNFGMTCHCWWNMVVSLWFSNETAVTGGTWVLHSWRNSKSSGKVYGHILGDKKVILLYLEGTNN